MFQYWNIGPKWVKEIEPLKDKFCDANDLSDAWDNMSIPEPILEFLCTLLNVDHKHFYENEVDKAVSKISNIKRMKIMALYQVLFYDVNNGEKETPLHVMNAEMIHNTCRSKTLITGFNHYGLCISYHELLRYHKDLASYVLSKNTDDVPLPSHFDTHIPSTGAFDNFDHNERTPSGLGSSHDTVSILIQDKPKVICRKPNISQTPVQHGCKAFIGPLPCQSLQEFYKSSKKIELPNNYSPSSELFTMDKAEYEDIITNDVAWVLCRLDLSNISNDTANPFAEERSIPS